MGVLEYTSDVALPSLAGYYLDFYNLIEYDYYSSPWEAQADKYGGVVRDPFADPWNESDGYFLDLTKKLIRGRIAQVIDFR